MVRIIKVVLPLDKADGTLALCKRICDKHALLGGASPLNGFLDVAAFDLKRAQALQKQTDGDLMEENAQALHGKAKMLCGIAEGQNKQTVETLYWFVLQIRDVLLTKNRGEENNLGTWGYNVVVSQTGARRNVRIDIPNDTVEKLSALAERIKVKHLALLLASPLLNAGLDMGDFEAKTNEARSLVESWKEADADAQAFHGQARTILGYSIGQTSETSGTLYYDIITVRDRLLQVYQDQEENMSQWGFEVVVSSRRVAKGSARSEGGGAAAAANN